MQSRKENYICAGSGNGFFNLINGYFIHYVNIDSVIKN